MQKQENQFLTIPISQIVVSTTNHRSQFDEALTNDLAASIKEKGLISPILVRPTPLPTKTIKYELVCGERRYKAHKIAGLKEILSIVRELSDEEAFEIQVIENLQRKDVHPLDEASAFKRMLESDMHKYTIDDIAAKVGKNKAYITQRLKLNDLNDEYKELFYKDTIQIGHAMELARLTLDDQKACAKKLTEKDWQSDQEYVIPLGKLKHFIKNQILLSLEDAPFPTDDAKLFAKAGACTTCAKRSGFNLELFGDIAESDRCFDGGCFEKKKENFLISQTEYLSIHNRPYKFITDDYTLDNEQVKKYPGILASREYKELNEDVNDHCNFDIAGVWTDEENFAKVIDICIDKSCQKHWKEEENEKSPTSLHASINYVNIKPRDRFAYTIKHLRNNNEKNVRERLVEKLKESPGYKTVSSAPLNEAEYLALVAKIYDNGLEGNVLEAIGIEEDSDFYVIEKLSAGQKNFIIRRGVLENFENAWNDFDKAALEKILSSYELGQEEIQAEADIKLEANIESERANFIHEHGFDPDDETETPIEKKVAEPVEAKKGKKKEKVL